MAINERGGKSSSELVGLAKDVRGPRCTSRSLNKHVLGEGKPLVTPLPRHFSHGKSHVVIPTNQGSVVFL